MATARKLRSLKVKTKEKGGKLTTAGRRALPKGAFALKNGKRPGVEGRYPIEDESHARNALARVSRFGTPAEKAAVRSAVAKKYPSIGKASKPGARKPKAASRKKR